MPDANRTRSLPHEVRFGQPDDVDLGLWVCGGCIDMIRNSTGCSLDHKGTQHREIRDSPVGSLFEQI